MVGWGRPADKENPSYTLSETKLHIFAQLVPGWLPLIKLIQKKQVDVRHLACLQYVYLVCHKALVDTSLLLQLLSMKPLHFTPFPNWIPFRIFPLSNNIRHYRAGEIDFLLPRNLDNLKPWCFFLWGNTPSVNLKITQHPHASQMWQTLCSKTFPNTRSKSQAALPAVDTLTRNLTHAKIIPQVVLNHTKTDLFNSLIPQCLIFRMVSKPNQHVELL